MNDGLSGIQIQFEHITSGKHLRIFDNTVIFVKSDEFAGINRYIFRERHISALSFYDFNNLYNLIESDWHMVLTIHVLVQRIRRKVDHTLPRS